MAQAAAEAHERRAAAMGGGTVKPIKGKDLPMRRLMMSYQRRGMTGSGTSRLGGPAKYVSLAGAPLASEVRVSAKTLKRGRGDSDAPDSGSASSGKNQAVVAKTFAGLDSLASVAVPGRPKRSAYGPGQSTAETTTTSNGGMTTISVPPPSLELPGLPGLPQGNLGAPSSLSSGATPANATQQGGQGWESVLRG